MATKKLGKGLDSLIGGGKKPETKATAPTVVKEVKSEIVYAEQMVKLINVEPNKDQPRKNFDDDALQELADSIRLHGIIEPLIVQKKKGNMFEIIAGERRWRAARIAGLKEVPVIVKEYSDQEVLEIALIENIQREDLNEIEEALAYKHLTEEYNMKQDEVAERVGKSRTAVTNSMRLLKLDKRVQQMVIDDMISAGHARALLAVTDGDAQYQLATKVFDEKLNVRDIEKLVKQLNNPKKDVKDKKDEKLDIIYRDLEEKLKLSLGSKVTIQRKAKNKGKIEIEYYSSDELDRLIALLNRK